MKELDKQKTELVYLQCPICRHTCELNEKMEHADDCEDKGFF